MKRALAGHLLTIAPVVRGKVRRTPIDVRERRLEWQIDDPVAGPVTFTGRLATPRDEVRPGRVVVLQHGLGGDVDSVYVRDAAAAVLARGIAVLRLNARGADPNVAQLDIPHAGLTDDIHAALSSRVFGEVDWIDAVGFSMGGHQLLRYACESRRSSTVRNVVAVSPPLDLGATRRFLDRRRGWIYRGHVLRSLKATWRTVKAQRPELRGCPVAMADRTATFAEWDARVVVSRHGFGSVEGYDAAACISRTIDELGVRTLVVASPWDPMIPWRPGEATLAAAPADQLAVWKIERGGHVAFVPPTRRAPWRVGVSELIGRIVTWCDANPPPGG